MARRTILGVPQSGAFFVRDDTVALGLVLYFIDVLLLIVQTVGLARIQLAVRNALIDTPFLIRLPLINARGLCLCEHNR